MRRMTEKAGTELHGKEMQDGDETYKCIISSETAFVWDHGTLSRANSDSPNDNFLGQLDSMLKPHGLEVVKIGFQGDCTPWFVDKIVGEESADPPV